MIHTVKGFGIVNKAEIDVFLELSCFLHDPADVGNLISGSSAFSKPSLNIWKFTVHILLKPGLENFESLEGFPRVALVVKSPPAQSRSCRRPGFDLGVGKIPWRRKGQPTPVFLPGESHGQRSLVGYSPWACKQSDTRRTKESF